MINIFLRRLLQPQAALSLIELLVALTILALPRIGRSAR
ncbi:MAG: prepilin-type N-terminal cleavage/methylation domain-containing protein [Alphaproteobacteria bacterium]|nr:prepilin-type N-terminal cleavage/methylation domain-containing protein [Alphaproteobacteria bacterium]